MRKIQILLLLLLFLLPVHAQKFIQLKDKAFNWGGKIGFSSTFPIVNSLSIDDTQAEDIRLQYKVGYLASFFGRVNIDLFFIQPSLAWRYSEGDILFNIPDRPQNLPGLPEETPTRFDSQLTYKTASVELPVMVGYYLIKEAPYALSIMVGPNIKYNYKTRYTTSFVDSPREYTSDSTPIAINIATGLGVSIGPLFLDFTYEFGLNQIESNFKDIISNEPAGNTMTIDKRTNAMSFSLGFLF